MLNRFIVKDRYVFGQLLTCTEIFPYEANKFVTILKPDIQNQVEECTYIFSLQKV